MRRKFNQSLLGYDPGQVDSAIKLATENHQAQMSQLRKELAQLAEQTTAQKKSISPLREELEDYRFQEQQLSARLLEAHLAATKQLLQVIKETEQTEEDMRQLVSHKENQVAELQAQLAQLRMDVQAMATKYAQAVTRVEVKADVERKGADFRKKP